MKRHADAEPEDAPDTKKSRQEIAFPTGEVLREATKTDNPPEAEGASSELVFPVDVLVGAVLREAIKTGEPEDWLAICLTSQECLCRGPAAAVRHVLAWQDARDEALSGGRLLMKTALEMGVDADQLVWVEDTCERDAFRSAVLFDWATQHPASDKRITMYKRLFERHARSSDLEYRNAIFCYGGRSLSPMSSHRPTDPQLASWRETIYASDTGLGMNYIMNVLEPRRPFDDTTRKFIEVCIRGRKTRELELTSRDFDWLFGAGPDVASDDDVKWLLERCVIILTGELGDGPWDSTRLMWLAARYRAALRPSRRRFLTYNMMTRFIHVHDAVEPEWLRFLLKGNIDDHLKLISRYGYDAPRVPFLSACRRAGIVLSKKRLTKHGIRLTDEIRAAAGLPLKSATSTAKDGAERLASLFKRHGCPDTVVTQRNVFAVYDALKHYLEEPSDIDDPEDSDDSSSSDA